MGISSSRQEKANNVAINRRVSAFDPKLIKGAQKSKRRRRSSSRIVKKTDANVCPDPESTWLKVKTDLPVSGCDHCVIGGFDPSGRIEVVNMDTATFVFPALSRQARRKKKSSKVKRGFARESPGGKYRSNNNGENSSRDVSSRKRQSSALKPGLFLVLDGHGSSGHVLVELVQDFITKNVTDAAATSLLSKGNEKQVEKFSIELFEGCQKMLENEVKEEGAFSGCTATLALLTGSYLHVASIGDCTAVLINRNASHPHWSASKGYSANRGGGAILEDKEDHSGYSNSSYVNSDSTWAGSERKRNKFFPVQTSLMHRATDASERERIIKAGGRVEPMSDGNGNFVGPPRVWKMGANIPGLCSTRSFGDFVGHELGVIHVPEIYHRQIDGTEAYLVIASDGLWEVMTMDEVTEFLDHALSKPDLITRHENRCGELLAKEAQRRWLRLVLHEETIVDDIAVLVVVFQTHHG
eukprot:g785.t1